MELFVVPTPVGNLGDITLRALETLKQADLILCEDTRTSGILLKHYDIQKPLQAYHMHNEHKVLEKIIGQIQSGQKLAIITDAGTPGISDPGFLLIRACVEADIKVTCLPGATAFVPAIVQSGISSTAFVFEGFLPQKKGRMTKLKQLAEEERTIVFYESPHRLGKSLVEMVTYFGGDRKVAVVREISKKFEETRRGTLAELSAYYGEHQIKGEIVVVLEGKVAVKKKKNKYAAAEDDNEE